MMRMIWVAAILGCFAAAWFFLFGPTGAGGPAGYIMVSGTSMEPNYYTGDLVITRKASSYEPGDVIAYRVPKDDPDAAGALIIHRVVGGNGTDGYIVQGDNRTLADTWRPKDADIVGKEWIFLAGKARYVEPLREPSTLAALAAFLAGLGVLGPSVKAVKRRPTGALLMTTRAR